ncbi:MAG TPA: D-glycerate dehydrogenase [Alphaproteobacteria bacterium]|nr:D-glycerate dehydrogenase [Alphaproteobacteria bacterium]
MSNKFKVYASCHIGGAAENLLRERGCELEIYPGPEAPPKKLIIEKVGSGIDGLITTLRDPIDAEVFAAGNGRLKVVSQIAVGFDNINRSDANRYKVPFTNTADVLNDATAEFTFLMMGMLSRRMWDSEKMVREQKWGAWHPFLPFLGDEISGKTIAVLGTGRIGLALVKKCLGFDMNVLCFDPVYQNQRFATDVQTLMDLRYRLEMTRTKNWIKYVSLEDALGQADYVSLHVPLVREGKTPTYHLINERTLKLMRKDAYLINAARGPVVDEHALARALKERWIAGAALDVFEKEPLPADSPLLDPEIEDRCRLFHHFASAGRITRLSTDPEKGMAGRCIQGLLDVLEGNYGGDVTRMPYVVNKEAWTNLGLDGEGI